MINSHRMRIEHWELSIGQISSAAWISPVSERPGLQYRKLFVLKGADVDAVARRPRDTPLVGRQAARTSCRYPVDCRIGKSKGSGQQSVRLSESSVRSERTKPDVESVDITLRGVQPTRVSVFQVVALRNCGTKVEPAGGFARLRDQ